MANDVEKSLFNILPWHGQYWDYLVMQFKKHRLPHALLLIGANGLGKQALARNLAALLLCHRKDHGIPCGNCGGCLLLASGNHPDLMYIAAEEDNGIIKIDQVREIVESLHSSAHQRGWRVVIIEQADMMNLAAANALLKSLEEPAVQTMLILTTAYANKLPATIRSRCQKLVIHTPAHIVAESWLRDKLVGVDVKLLLILANGAPLQALSWGMTEFFAKRKTLFEHIYTLVFDHNHWDAVLEAASVFDLNELILLLLYVILDLIKLKLLVSATLVNEDEIVKLTALAIVADLSKIFAYQQELFRLKEYLLSKFNLNRRVILERLVIDWLRCFVHNTI
jgi:DNA polymerase-3 subunit delta'